MDPSLKKRKSDENGTAISDTQSTLTPEDLARIIEPFTKEQLSEIVQNAVCRQIDVLDAVRAIADRDPSQRKLFIRGLGWDTTSEGLRALFSTYGELEEAIVILDKVTSKSKGYGFVTFKHVDGALCALKEPSKKIDGRVTVTQLKSAGITAGVTGPVPGVDVGGRKVFVGNVPYDMAPDRLLAHFTSYGEVEEGPLGYDKTTGKSRGFALFVYKTVEGARAAVAEPNKVIDGVQMISKFATDNKKGKLMGPAVGGLQQPQQGQTVQTPTAAAGDVNGDGHGIPPPSTIPGSYPSQYGVPGGHVGGLGLPGGVPGGPVGVPGGPMGLGAGGGIPGYGPYGAPYGGAAAHQSAAGLAHQHQNQHQHQHQHQHQNLNSGLPGAGLGLSSAGSHLPSTLGGNGPYGAGLGGAYTGLGGVPTSGPYGGHYPGPGTVGYSGLGVGASSLYRPSGGYGETAAHYSLSSSTHHPPSASSPVPKGSMYPNLPPYY